MQDELFLVMMTLVPILMLLVLLLFCNWKASRAALLGLIVAIVLSLIVFDAPAQVVLGEGLKGVWSAIPIIFVIFTAVYLGQLTNTIGGFKTIIGQLNAITANEMIHLLFIAWGISSFLQGITGFGVPAAICAALLVQMGVRPVYAVLMSLIGHAWANTFGTLAVAWDALLTSAGISVGSEESFKIAFWCGIFLWIFNFFSGSFICFLYGRTAALKKMIPMIFITSTIQCGGQLLLSFRNATIAAFIPTVLALVEIVILSKVLPQYTTFWRIKDSPVMQRALSAESCNRAEKNMSLLLAILPYGILCTITLACSLIQPLHSFLNSFTVSLAFPETQTPFIVNPAVSSYAPIAPFSHPGIYLFLTGLLSTLFYRHFGCLSTAMLHSVLKNTVKNATPAAITLLSMMIMSNIMRGTGQTNLLATTAAIHLSDVYPLCSPIIGWLGSLITGSNMSSNILFGQLQYSTAQILTLDCAPIMAAQTVGGAVGCAVSPSNIAFACLATKIAGQEGVVLKKLIPFAMLFLLIIGICALVVSR